MQKSKLVSWLRALEKDEYKRFEQSLKKEFSSKGNPVVLLYKYLKKELRKDAMSAQLSKEKVFNHLFKDKNLDRAVLQTIMWKLTTRIEAFIIQEEIKHPKTRKRILHQALSERKSFPIFETNANQLIKDLETAPANSLFDYFMLHEINHFIFFHPYSDHVSANIKNLEKAGEYLDLSFILFKLRYTCEWVARNGILNDTPRKIKLLDNIYQIIEVEKLYEKNPLFKLYPLIIKLHQHKEKGNLFQAIRVEFENCEQFIHKKEQLYILNNLTNYCIKSHRIDSAQIHLESLFDLYKYGITSGIYLENGKLTDLTFLNIVLAGAALKEYNWTKKFIDEYADLIQSESRENVTALSRAYLFFNQKDFDAAHDQLVSVKFKKTYQYHSKILLLRIYFEGFLKNKNAFNQALPSLLASFSRFLKKEREIANQTRVAYLNFVKFLRKIYALFLKQDQFSKEDFRAKIKQIADEIKNTNPVVHKDWLLSKLK